MKSAIIQFYLNEDRNTEGYLYSDVMSFSLDRMEADHAYIQWLFPLEEPSSFNPDAPLLTADDITQFNGSYLLKTRLGDAFDKFLGFLGLSYRSRNIIITPEFYERGQINFVKANHNWFRISRMLKSCCLLGVKERPLDFFRFLSLINFAQNGIVGWKTSFKHWEDAVKSLKE